MVLTVIIVFCLQGILSSPLLFIFFFLMVLILKVVFLDIKEPCINLLQHVL